MRPFLVGLLTLLAIVLAACGSDDGGSRTGDATSAPTTSSPAAATAQAGTPTSLAEAAASAVAADLLGVFTAIQQRLQAAEQVHALARDPRLDDPAWQASIREALDTLRAATTTIAGLKAVSCLQSVQTALQRSTQQTTQALDQLAEAIMQRNPLTIAAANDRLTESDRTIALALVSLQGLRC
jgi:hypothetical protein